MKERYGPTGTVGDALAKTVSAVKRLSSSDDTEELGSLVDLIEHIRCVLAVFNTNERELGKHLTIKLLVDLARKLTPDLLKEWKNELHKFCEENPSVDPQLEVFAKFAVKVYKCARNPFLSKLSTVKPDKYYKALATDSGSSSESAADKERSKPKNPCILHKSSDHEFSKYEVYSRFDASKR